ncbi:MAG: isochorismatase family cysteine hydrolase [Chloroflexota bacterium]
MHLTLPVRFTGKAEHEAAFTTLKLDVKKTAVLLVDCTFENPPESDVGQVLRKVIAPMLATARSVGMKAIFIHGGDHSAHKAMPTEVHRIRRQRAYEPRVWQPATPVWVSDVEPLAGDAVIEKNGQNAFQGTRLDLYLRTLGIETLLCVGFSFKSCLFYSMIGAFEHNYRVVFLRDGTHPLGENEFADTLNDSLPEKGWVRLVLTRLIEDHLGYSSTCEEVNEAIDHAKAQRREGTV